MVCGFRLPWLLLAREFFSNRWGCVRGSPTPLFSVHFSPTLNSCKARKMSTVYLSNLKGASKLDSYTGLPVEDDELGASRSTPLLSGGLSPTSKGTLTPLLNRVLRGKNLRDSKGLEGISSLLELGSRERGDGAEDVGEGEEGGERRTSSFVDLLESRDIEMDKAWMDMQVWRNAIERGID